MELLIYWTGDDGGSLSLSSRGPSRQAHPQPAAALHGWPDALQDALEAAGIAAPKEVDGVKQQPIDGIAMNYTFDSATEPSHRHTQPFEMVQNMGIYRDGWWAGTKPVTAPWDYFKPAASVAPDQRVWELYDIGNDEFIDMDMRVWRHPYRTGTMLTGFVRRRRG